MQCSWIHRKLSAVGVGLLAFACQLNSAYAQEKSAIYLPQDSIVVFAIDMATIQNNKDLEVVPWEVASAAGKEYVGVDPLLASQVWGAVGLPSLAGPEIGIHITTSQPVNIDDLKPEFFGPAKTSAKAPDVKLRPMTDTPMSVVQNKNGILFGTEATLRKMMAARGTPSKHIAMLAADKDPVRVAIAIEPLRDLIITSLEQYQFMLTADIVSDLTELVNKTDYVYMQSTIGYDISTKIHFGAADEASAKQVQELLVGLRAQGFDQILNQINAQMSYVSMSDELRTAWGEYLTRARGLIEASTEPVLADNRATIELKNIQSYYLTSMVFGMLVPAFEAARFSIEEAAPANNLKEIGLAFHNHESAFKKFPPRAITDDEGKPLLSWRVKLLPFVEESSLYNEFHMDEPWDSEHNKELLAKMPDAYKNPRVDLPEGFTTYVAPYGGRDEKRTIWDIENCGFRNVTDGTSNTIMFVEVNAEAAVPWTKPDDFDIAAKSLLEFLLKSPEGGVIGICDGSVYNFDDSLDEEILDALLSAGGGEVVQLP